jgi:hypothetical protein
MAGRGVIRRLWPSELDRVRAHLLRLGPESRRLRFGGLVGPAQIAAHCAGLDRRAAVIVGNLEAGELRGLGELLLAPVSGVRSGELAVSVKRRWRNRGHGLSSMQPGGKKGAALPPGSRRQAPRPDRRERLKSREFWWLAAS